MKTTEKTINIDYLQLAFLTELPSWSNNPKTFEINSECYLEYKPQESNPDFTIIANLYIHHHLVGKVLYAPSSPFIDDNTVHLLIENWLLYTDEFTTYIKYLQQTCHWELQHIARLDICIDTTNHNLDQFFVKYLRSDSIRKKGRAELQTKYNSNKELKYLWVGSNKSKKQVKYYNKSKELEIHDKPYIKYFWNQNGLDINSRVERLELKLMNPLTKGIYINRLTDSNYLASLVQLHWKNFFDFEQTHKENYRKITKDVTPLKLTGFETELLLKYKPTRTTSTIEIKKELRRLYIQTQIEKQILSEKTNPTGQDYHPLNYFYGSLRRLKKRYKLDEYYKSKKPLWSKEYEKNQSIYK